MSHYASSEGVQNNTHWNQNMSTLRPSRFVSDRNEPGMVLKQAVHPDKATAISGITDADSDANAGTSCLSPRNIKVSLLPIVDSRMPSSAVRSGLKLGQEIKGSEEISTFEDGGYDDVIESRDESVEDSDTNADAEAIADPDNQSAISSMTSSSLTEEEIDGNSSNLGSSVSGRKETESYDIEAKLSVPKLSMWSDPDTVIPSASSPTKSRAATAATAVASLIIAQNSQFGGPEGTLEGQSTSSKVRDSVVDQASTTISSIMETGSSSGKKIPVAITPGDRKEVSFSQVRDAMRQFLSSPSFKKPIDSTDNQAAVTSVETSQIEHQTAFWSKCAILSAAAVMTTAKSSHNKIQLAQAAAETVLCNCHKEDSSESVDQDWQIHAADHLEEVATEVSLAIMSISREGTEREQNDAIAAASAVSVVILNQRELLSSSSSKALNEVQRRDPKDSPQDPDGIHSPPINETSDDDRTEQTTNTAALISMAPSLDEACDMSASAKPADAQDKNPEAKEEAEAEEEAEADADAIAPAASFSGLKKGFLLGSTKKKKKKEKNNSIQKIPFAATEEPVVKTQSEMMLEKDDKQNDAQTAEPPKRKGPTALEAALDGSVFQMNLDALLIENESVDDDEMEVETTPVAAAKSGQADESTEINIKETKNDPALYGAVEILLNPAMYEAVQTILFYPTKQEVAEVSVAIQKDAHEEEGERSLDENVTLTKDDEEVNAENGPGDAVSNIDAYEEAWNQIKCNPKKENEARDARTRSSSTTSMSSGSYSSSENRKVDPDMDVPSPESMADCVVEMAAEGGTIGWYTFCTLLDQVLGICGGVESARKSASDLEPQEDVSTKPEESIQPVEKGSVEELVQPAEKGSVEEPVQPAEMGSVEVPIQKETPEQTSDESTKKDSISDEITVLYSNTQEEQCVEVPFGLAAAPNPVSSEKEERKVETSTKKDKKKILMKKMMKKLKR